MTNVLIAIDDDHFGDLIGDFICQHKWQPNTTFRVVNVLPWMPPEKEIRVSLDLQNYVEVTRKSRKELVDRFVGRLTESLIEKDVRVEQDMLHGKNAAEMILQVAESWPANLLIVGSHGRKGMSLFLLGSVSSALVNHAPCSVIVIRPPADSAIDKDQSRETSAAR